MSQSNGAANRLTGSEVVERRLEVEGGALAFDVRGQGPLVVCVPGMGDVRQGWDDLARGLVDAGHRVATLDLRGHGGSTVGFADHSRPAAGRDVVALVAHLGGAPAHLIGCSYGASAVAWAAGTRPDLVSGLTLVGPFVRDLPVTAVQRLGLRAMLARPWGAWAWSAWFRALHKTRPADLGIRVAQVRAMLAQPGRLEAVRAMAVTGCAEVEAALDGVTAPALVVMGAADPDFPDPAAETDVIAARLGGTVLLVPDAGHYTHIERSDLVVPAITAHLCRSGRCHPAA